MHSTVISSTQRVATHHKGEILHLALPAATTKLWGHDIRWGLAEEIGSPAYWTAQAWMWGLEEPDHYRLGRTLREEVLACLLGGYGIPAEIGLAAYERLRAAPAGDLENEALVRAMLIEPLSVNGRDVRYRFAAQKARYVALAMQALPMIDDRAADRDLRDALVQIPGIGLKTASWIVRNWRGSDDVSILDIHIIRACRMLRIFDPSWRVERHYLAMEDAYLKFAQAVGARASILDSVIWMTMRQLPASIINGLMARPLPPPKYTQSEANFSGQLSFI